MLWRKFAAYMILFTLAFGLLPWIGKAPAAQAAQAASKIDAMLVVDVSHSMDTSDTDKIGNEAMKMFVDMLSSSGDKVGIVAYTDRIEREKALLNIQSQTDKEDLKQFIDQLSRGPYTDIAVGVKEAVKVLQQGSDPAHDPMIVLLADGNNYLNKNGGRTQAESDQELSAAVEDAKRQGIPIYTIGLNADGQLNKEALAELSQQTNGKSFVTSSADDLPQIWSEIFASHQKLKIVPVQSITGDGSYQNVTVNVPNANVMEANISIMSLKPVEWKLYDPSGKEVAIPSDDVQMSRSKSYSLLKLLQPGQGDWKLQVKGADKDRIDINLVFNYDLELTMDPIPSKTYNLGDKIKIGAYLASNGQQLQNDVLYRNMSAVLNVKDLDTGDTVDLPLDQAGDRFEGEFEVKDKHDYEITVRAEEKSFYRETEPVKVSAKPAGAGASAQAGAGDGEADKPFPMWIVYAGIGLIVLALAAGFLLAAWKKASRGFVGQMVIEIRNENTGEKTYPQYKKLTAFKGKFTLHQLLQLAPEFKETEKMVFMPGKSDRILLKNGSAGTVEKSGRAVDASSGLELKSGDRITVPLQQVDKTVWIEYIV